MMIRGGHSGWFPCTSSKQKKTITKKIEKMSEEEVKGFQSGLDNLA